MTNLQLYRIYFPQFTLLMDMGNLMLYISYSIPASMGDLSITQESIYNKLCDLNSSKSPGPDMLHPRVLYETRDIAYPLFLIYRPRKCL